MTPPVAAPPRVAPEGPLLQDDPLAAPAPAHSPVVEAAPTLRVGGMAFGNGVLMRSGASWAWARDDGSVLQGRVPVPPSGSIWLRVPVLRAVVALADMIHLSVQLHRLNGRRRGLRLLVALVACVLVSLPVTAALDATIASDLLSAVAVQVVSLVVSLAIISFGMGGEVWRYHGAEHKAVNAYEAGVDLDEPEAVMHHSRIHERCGTNLLVIVFALTLLLLPLGYSVPAQALSVVLMAVLIAVAIELFRLLQRRPQAIVSRVVLSGGKTLQRFVTTREPRREHVELACAALREVVAAESRAS